LPKSDDSGILETIIKDTGLGIAIDRIPYMFQAFGELKQKQSMRFVKDKGIGVGLSCSKILTEALEGQICIV
jgi:signal transduction histidine kinase